MKYYQSTLLKIFIFLVGTSALCATEEEMEQPGSEKVSLTLITMNSFIQHNYDTCELEIEKKTNLQVNSGKSLTTILKQEEINVEDYWFFKDEFPKNHEDLTSQEKRIDPNKIFLKEESKIVYVPKKVKVKMGFGKYNHKDYECNIEDSVAESIKKNLSIKQNQIYCVSIYPLGADSAYNEIDKPESYYIYDLYRPSEDDSVRVCNLLATYTKNPLNRTMFSSTSGWSLLVTTKIKVKIKNMYGETKVLKLKNDKISDFSRMLFISKEYLNMYTHHAYLLTEDSQKKQKIRNNQIHVSDSQTEVTILVVPIEKKISLYVDDKKYSRIEYEWKYSLKSFIDNVVQEKVGISNYSKKDELREKVKNNKFKLYLKKKETVTNIADFNTESGTIYDLETKYKFVRDNFELHIDFSKEEIDETTNEESDKQDDEDTEYNITQQQNNINNRQTEKALRNKDINITSGEIDGNPYQTINIHALNGYNNIYQENLQFDGVDDEKEDISQGENNDNEDEDNEYYNIGTLRIEDIDLGENNENIINFQNEAIENEYGIIVNRRVERNELFNGATKVEKGEFQPENGKREDIIDIDNQGGESNQYGNNNDEEDNKIVNLERIVDEMGESLNRERNNGKTANSNKDDNISNRGVRVNGYEDNDILNIKKRYTNSNLINEYEENEGEEDELLGIGTKLQNREFQPENGEIKDTIDIDNQGVGPNQNKDNDSSNIEYGKYNFIELLNPRINLENIEFQDENEEINGTLLDNNQEIKDNQGVGSNQFFNRAKKVDKGGLQPENEEREDFKDKNKRKLGVGGWIVMTIVVGGFVVGILAWYKKRKERSQYQVYM
ncbi:MAG: hypothetical protein AAF770_01340 [Bacteroidota bacterium]